MKETILRMLHPLIDEPLCGMFRVFGMQVFEFGVRRPDKNRRSEEVFVADLRLHVSCFWRINGPDGFAVSRNDFGPDGSRHDEKAYPFYESLFGDKPPVIKAIEADDAGALLLQMSQGYTLQIQPDSMEEELDEEQWRFLPKGINQRHLVLTLQGLE